MNNGTAIIFLVLLVVVLAVLSPLALVWSINTLFGTTIAYGFWEWLAALVLLSFFQSKNVAASFNNKQK